MSKKGGNFFEEHIEKIILAIVGLVCIWLLISRVLISPNVVSYDGERFGPGDIDDYISRQAVALEENLSRKPEPKPAYERRVDDFVARLDSAIHNIDTTVYPPIPPHITEVRVKRAYDIPSVGEVNNVRVEHIRAVAYVPAETINEEKVYAEAETEPDDLDFVTVEAKFDVSGLYKNFYENFAGGNVREQWRDPCLAEPVFAAVQLQRQELGADGWGDWQIVPRTRIDHRKGMFEVIEDVKKLPAGGIKVRLLQFNEGQVKMDLLQPEAYRIASAKEEWFPPSLHRKFVKQQRGEKKVERRGGARVAEREGRERERGRVERRGRTSKKTRRRPREGVYDDAAMEELLIRGRRGSSERRGDRERPEKSREIPKATSKSDVYDEFGKILITERTDFAKMREPLVFWAHDDTVKPEKSYRYRIRLGVFNPIAGTNQFSERGERLKNKVILWSGFSDVTEPIGIPGRLYFFPRDIQETAKIATVTVCRYALGYWYSKDFAVKRGEVIGRVVKSEAGQVKKGVVVPDTIDYATGAVLVDVVAVNDWSGGRNLRARHYFDMLYSFDGTSIKHIPVKTRYWAEELQAKFNEIKKSEKEPKEPLREWGRRPAERRRRAPGEYEEYEELMQMMEKGRY